MSVLSGEALLSAKLAKSQSKVLPSAGEKLTIANGSWLEKTQIESLLDEQHEWIAEEKTEKRSQLSEATWNEDLGLAEVTKRTGSCWQNFGFQEGTTVYLRPEEALFLVETTCLELRYGGAPVSIQQGYELLIKNQDDLQSYRVYRELMQVGYKARRSKDLNLCELPDLASNLPKSDKKPAEKEAENSKDDLSTVVDDEKDMDFPVDEKQNSLLEEPDIKACETAESLTARSKEAEEESRNVHEKDVVQSDLESEKCGTNQEDKSKGCRDSEHSEETVRKRAAEPESLPHSKKSRPDSYFSSELTFGIDSDEDCMIVDEIDSLCPSRSDDMRKVVLVPSKVPLKEALTEQSGSDLASRDLENKDSKNVENGCTGGPPAEGQADSDDDIVFLSKSEGSSDFDSDVSDLEPPGFSIFEVVDLVDDDSHAPASSEPVVNKVSWRLGSKSGTGLSSALEACQQSVFIPFGQAKKDFAADDEIAVLPKENKTASAPEIILLDDDEPQGSELRTADKVEVSQSAEGDLPKVEVSQSAEGDLPTPKGPEGEALPVQTGEKTPSGLYVPSDGTCRWDLSVLWGNVPENLNEEKDTLKRMKDRLKFMPQSPKRAELLAKYETLLYPFSKKVYEVYSAKKKKKSKDRSLNGESSVQRGLYVPESRTYHWDESVLWENVPERFKRVAEELKQKKEQLKSLQDDSKKSKLINEYETLLYPFSKKVYESYISRKTKKSTEEVAEGESGDSEFVETLDEIIDLTDGDDERDRLLAMIPSVAGTSKVIIPVPSSQFLPRNVDPAFPFYTWEGGKCNPSVLVDRVASSAPKPLISTPPPALLPPAVTPLQSFNSRLPGGYTVYSPSFSHRRFGINPWTNNSWGAFQLNVFGRATPFGFQNFGPNRLPRTEQYQRYRSHFGRQNQRRPQRGRSPPRREQRSVSSAAEERGATQPKSESPPVVKTELLDPMDTNMSVLPQVRGTSSRVSWKQYKEAVAAIMVKQEPKDVEVKQERLVPPDEPIGSILKRLSVVKNVGKPTMSGLKNNTVKPVYDLFSPDVRYRKSATDPPNFRLAISRGMNMPSGEDLQPFLSSCEETVSPVVAVPLSSVLYFEIAQFEIPVLEDSS